MIPLQYRLREAVRVEPASGNTWRVVCGSPLTVLTVNAAAARLLERLRTGVSVGTLAGECGLSEERVFVLCERLRRRGLLEAGRVAAGPDFLPTVTVIVPARDRADDLDDCLQALSQVDYPAGLFELVVVDDGSADPVAIAVVTARHGGRLLVNERNRGPAYSRNRGAWEATSDLLAFIDSDCVPERGWLRELTAYFSWARVGAVGGRTLGYYTESRLDRYEEVASPLDMGRHLVVEGPGTSTFYVPTCNLLVRRCAYQAVGGLREHLRVGEDVDLCWRLRATGAYLVYAPEGVVRHKHRDRLGAMLRRRAQYGTSEAPLYALHPDKRKRFSTAPAPVATAALLSLALIWRKPWLLPACLAPALWDGLRRTGHLREMGVDLSAQDVWTAVRRGHLSMLYFAYFHLVRYYLGPLAAAGLFSRGLRVFACAAAVYAAGVDYATRRPRMSFPAFLAYYLAEHAAYQAGVVTGCVKAGTFRSYLPAFERPNGRGSGLEEAGLPAGRDTNMTRRPCDD